MFLSTSKEIEELGLLFYCDMVPWILRCSASLLSLSLSLVRCNNVDQKGQTLISGKETQRNWNCCMLLVFTFVESPVCIFYFLVCLDCFTHILHQPPKQKVPLKILQGINQKNNIRESKQRAIVCSLYFSIDFLDCHPIDSPFCLR
jgi:hypothetical protein